MDNKGLFYYLGTLNRDTWSSPVGNVKVEASTQGGSNLISIFDRVGESSVENLFSAPGPQWLSVSLERGALCPTGYWLKQESTRMSHYFFCKILSLYISFKPLKAVLTGRTGCPSQMIGTSEIGNFKEQHRRIETLGSPSLATRTTKRPTAKICPDIGPSKRQHASRHLESMFSAKVRRLAAAQVIATSASNNWSCTGSTVRRTRDIS
jgi:hypothetical protein